MAKSVRVCVCTVAAAGLFSAVGFYAASLRGTHSREKLLTSSGSARYRVPAFHSSSPTSHLRATLPPSQFTDALSQRAYRLAGRIKGVLYQLPCYCYCDRAIDHTSLLSCYQDTHGSECEVCKKELFYAYQQRRQGKSVAQIRAGIIRGEWEEVNLAKWVAVPPVKQPPNK